MGPIWLAFSGFLWLMLVLFHRSSPPTTEEDSRGSFPGRNPDPSSSHLESDDDDGSPLGAPEQKDTQSDVRLFHKYMKLHNKTYRFGSQEYFTRYENFLATLSRRSSLLSANVGPELKSPVRSAIYGLNQFSDLSADEFHDLYLTLEAPGKHRRKGDFKSSILPAQKLRRHLKQLDYPLKWDWRDWKAVTPIKNQGHCGACYAVSTVAMIETMRSLKLGRLSEDLSVQQVLDCPRRSHGCGGGDPQRVLAWINGTKYCKLQWRNFRLREYDCQWRYSHKLALEKDYPSHYVDEECLAGANDKGLVQIRDYYCHMNVNELDILSNVYKQGPVTVAVDSSSWQDYLGGIIQYNCRHDVNHAVVIVGYDVSGPVPYYIIKNSWGESFGDAGYVYVRVGTNLCGIRFQVCGATF